VVKSEPNVSTTYKKAPQYWNDQAGKLAGMTVSFVAQAPSRLAAVQAGDYDVVQVTGDIFRQADSLAKSGAFQMVTSVASSRDIFLNTEKGDLADPNVRKAIALAINRNDLAAIQPCTENSQPMPQSSWSYNPAIKNVYDPAQAKDLIQKRGGASFDLAYAAGSSYEPFAQVIQSQLKDVGIKVNLRPIEQSQTNSQFASGQVDAILSSISPAPDPQVMLNRYYFGGTNLLRGALRDQIAADLAPATKPGATQAERAPIYQQAFKTMADENIYVPTCQSTQGWAYKKPVVGLDTMPGLAIGIPDFTFIGVEKK
jgi:peptide/nickel transport system substrate-binding protein